MAKREGRKSKKIARQEPAALDAGAAAGAGNDPVGPEPTGQADRRAMPVDHENPPRLPFPVVGIGASAGGLEAFTEFIEAMPPDSGMAIVFIQHLSPERESLIAGILAHKTRMKVLQVEEQMAIEPNHVYVIRPGKVLTMREGRFHLGEQLGGRAANRPIDDFFRSLAQEQRQRAVAVILSGMGSNGSAGAQAVKAVGGLVVAQDPESAQFASMPRHLIDQGYADAILLPRDIPEALLHYAGHPYAREAHHDATDQVERNRHHVREVLAILRTRTRTDFSGYKKPTVLRRVQRRMGLTRMTAMAQYVKLLRHSPAEVAALADDLLIHVTGFFRDQPSWNALLQQVIIPLVARSESEIRCWVTACSSGEEAYSLAMLLMEETERAGKPLGIKVFATDMAERPLLHARAGVYPGGIESEVNPQRLERFFDKEDGVYRIKQDVRECVIFAPQNLLQDPPFSRLDIVSCRNLLIYLEPAVQQRVLQMLHFGLREGGALFLGSSETVAGAEELYELIDKKARIFRRVGPLRHGALEFPLPRALRGAGSGGGAGAGGAGGEGAGESASGPTMADEARAADRRLMARPSIALLTQRTLLERHIAAAVAVDRDHRIVYFHGNTAAFIEQPPGEPTRDLLSLARPGLRGSIRTALRRCAAEQRAVTVLDGWLETTPGRQVRIAVTASPVAADDAARHFVVSFEELDDLRPLPPNGADPGAGAAEEDLRRMREELQSTIEALQSSNEELKAANEEVTSVNEEFQSTNEELETSKEEMQSLNEELTTLNAQLQAKMEEHQAARNDMAALLNGTAIAVLFLDNTFRIRRYTPAVRELMDLIPGDVGRPLQDLHRKFDDPHLEVDVAAVLEKLVPIEREVPAEDGRHYVRRALPYRTVDDRIDGVVVTFVDVTDRKRAEVEVAAAREYAESIVDTLHEPLLVLRPDLTVRSANPAFYEHFKVAAAETLGRKIYDLGNGQWNIPALRTALEEVLPANKVFTGHEVTHDFKDIGRRTMVLNGRRLDHVQLILLGVRDVTDRHADEQALRASRERLQRMMNIEGAGVLTFDEQTGVLLDANDAFLDMSGYTRADVSSHQLTWRTLTPPEHIEISELQMRQLGQTGRVGPYEKEYLRRDGTRAWMMFTGARMEDGTVVEYCIDVSDWKRTETALRGSEQRFRLIADNVSDYAILTTDRQGRVTSWNVGAQRIFQYAADEMVGRDSGLLFTPEDRAARAHESELETAAREGRASDDRWQMRKDGSRFWASGVSTAIRDDRSGLIGFVKILRDETGRKELEEQLRTANEALEQRVAERTGALHAHQRQLRSLVAELSRAELRERRLLANELHDNLAQLLAVCKMRVSAIEAANDPSAAQREAGAVKEALGDAIAYTRTLMGDLRPDILDEHDLAAALTWIAQRMSRHGLKVTVAEDHKPKPVYEDVLGFLFQAVRELLWNVVKHARTTQASVRIERTDGHVRVIVHDDGVGFDAARRAALPTEHGGFGLFSIAERIDLLGGEIEVDSAPRRGARITLTAPLDLGGQANQVRSAAGDSGDDAGDDTGDAAGA